MKRGQVVVAHRQVLLGQDKGAEAQRRPHLPPQSCTIRGGSQTHVAQCTPAASLRLCQLYSRLSASSSSQRLSAQAPPTWPSPTHTDPPCLLKAPYQFLQSSQFLWQVAEASAVQLQPSQTRHGLDILREVASLRGMPW